MVKYQFRIIRLISYQTHSPPRCSASSLELIWTNTTVTPTPLHPDLLQPRKCVQWSERGEDSFVIAAPLFLFSSESWVCLGWSMLRMDANTLPGPWLVSVKQLILQSVMERVICLCSTTNTPPRIHNRLQHIHIPRITHNTRTSTGVWDDSSETAPDHGAECLGSHWCCWCSIRSLQCVAVQLQWHYPATLPLVMSVRDLRPGLLPTSSNFTMTWTKMMVSWRWTLIWSIQPCQHNNMINTALALVSNINQLFSSNVEWLIYILSTLFSSWLIKQRHKEWPAPDELFIRGSWHEEWVVEIMTKTEITMSS